MHSYYSKKVFYILLDLFAKDMLDNFYSIRQYCFRFNYRLWICMATQQLDTTAMIGEYPRRLMSPKPKGRAQQREDENNCDRVQKMYKDH